jgi:uncharacterized membrane protein
MLKEDVPFVVQKKLQTTKDSLVEIVDIQTKRFKRNYDWLFKVSLVVKKKIYSCS